MNQKPTSQAGYDPVALARVRSTCLYIATILGNVLDDIVIVGGFAPNLLVDQEHLPVGLDAHAGTMDLDLGLALDLLREERYRELSQSLREVGFEPDVNESGNPTRQRWRSSSDRSVTIDFLISPSEEAEEGGTLFDIEPDLAAVVTPGLHLAFQDRRQVPLSGQTILQENASRDIWVCGPGSLTVLKALAFGDRGANKDAYDLAYVWRALGVDQIAEFLAPLLGDPVVARALSIIQEDFTEHNGIGPRRAAAFQPGVPSEETQADVVGMATRLLSLLSLPPLELK